MRLSIFFATSALAVPLALFDATQGNRSQAAEPAEEFLQALRDRRFHDLALDYLQRMQTNPSAPAGFVDSILYQQGVTLMDAARYERDASLREEQLGQAHEKLNQFLARHKDHGLADAAAEQLGGLIMQRAALRVAKADQASDAATQQAFYADARQLYDQANQLFQNRLQTIREQLTALPKSIDPKRQAALLEQRNQLRAEYVQSQLVAALIIYERAATLKNNEQQYRQSLSEAADAYGEIAKKYRNRLAGLYSVLYRGRCYQDLGDFKQALFYYDELLQQPDPSDEFRRLRTKTLMRAMQCWLEESVGGLETALEQGDRWIAQARQNEQNDPDWLAIRWLLSQASFEKAAVLEDSQTESNRWLAKARKQAKFVARQPGEYAPPAKQLLARMQRRAGEPENKPAPKTFAEANEAAREALDRMRNASYLITLVQPKVARTQDAQRKKEMEQQINEAQSTLRESSSKGILYGRLALQLADREADVEQLNPIRHSLCQFYYIHGDYFDAAVLGQFLAMRYPESPGARQAARIAFAAYYKLYAANSGTDAAFAVRRIVNIADFITKQWPGQPEVEDALATLVTFMVHQGDLVKAEEYLAKIPANSNRRGAAERRTGQALWARYLQSQRTSSHTGNGLDAPGVSDREAWRTKAQELLADGIGRAGDDEIDAALLRAVLSLAQIYSAVGQPEKAITLLEDTRIGPLALANKKDPRVAEGQLAVTIYKTALSAAIAALPSAENPDAFMAKATAMMDALRSAVSDTPEGKKKLISIYVRLARDLERQMESSPPNVQKSLAAGFETFLGRVAEQANEFNVIYWVAETFFGLGAGLDTGNGPTSSQARSFYEKAAATYQKILESSASGPSKPDANTIIQVRVRLAATRRRLRDYQAAIAMFQSILNENNLLINVQIDAAQTYQEWGATGKSQYYDRAILGGRPNKKTNKNTIWGWQRISRVAATQMYRGEEYKQKFNDVFHQARYNIARSLYQKAMTQSGEKRGPTLQQAETAISSTYSLYPAMGGETWKPQYDRLLRRIQKGLGKKNGGLESLNLMAGNARR